MNETREQIEAATEQAIREWMAALEVDYSRLETSARSMLSNAENFASNRFFLRGGGGPLLLELAAALRKAKEVHAFYLDAMDLVIDAAENRAMLNLPRATVPDVELPN